MQIVDSSDELFNRRLEMVEKDVEVLNQFKQSVAIEQAKGIEREKSTIRWMESIDGRLDSWDANMKWLFRAVLGIAIALVLNFAFGGGFDLT